MIGAAPMIWRSDVVYRQANTKSSIVRRRSERDLATPEARPSLPRVSKRLTMGRWAEGEIKPACRSVSLRSEAACVSSLG